MLKKTIAITLLSLLLLTCKKQDEKPLFFKSEYEQEKWDFLQEKIGPLEALSDKIEWVDEVYHLFIESDKSRDLISYFGEVAASDPDPLFSSYLYFIISNIYWEHKEIDLSVYYIAKIDPAVYPLVYDSQEIGYLIALRTLKLKNYNSLKERMCKMLLEDYKDLVDEIMILNELVYLYKEKMDIERAIRTMKEILRLSRKMPIVDKSIDLKEMRNEINFYYSDKEWVHQDLTVLINRIKYAIQRKNSQLLREYVSNVDFKIKLFQKKNQFNWTYNEIAIHKRWHSNIVFARNLEDFSNENEAFLQTKNWNFPQMRTWYFYFKRVDYPYDKNIDGGWEWKGIYFGDWF